jgi:hypothetical protein
MAEAGRWVVMQLFLLMVWTTRWAGRKSRHGQEEVRIKGKQQEIHVS